MCAHGLPFARSCAHGRKCNVQNLRLCPYIFVLRMRATYCVQRTVCNVLRATYCVQRSACNVLCAAFCVQCTACSVLCANIVLSMVQSICALPVGASGQNHRRVQDIFMDACLHNFALGCLTTILIFIRYRIFTTALLPTGNTYDSVTISVIRYIHVPLLLIHCVVTGFTN